jgi:drug/metabolite transporter (DMT)-like permease
MSKAGKEEFSSVKRLIELHIVMSAVIFIISAATVKNGIDTSPYIVISALLYAVTTVLSQFSYVKAVEKGPVSVCTLFCSCGFIIPSFWGLFYGEVITFFQWAGFMLLLISLTLSVGKKKLERENTRWLLFAVSAMIGSGVLGVIQKVYRLSEFGNDTDSLLTLAFAFMLALLLILNRFAGRANHGGNNKKFFALSILMGICYVVVSKSNLWLAGALPAMVMFPCSNGGYILMTSVFSALLLKERIEAKQWVGILSGFASIVVIAMG